MSGYIGAAPQTSVRQDFKARAVIATGTELPPSAFFGTIDNDGADGPVEYVLPAPALVRNKACRFAQEYPDPVNLHADSAIVRHGKLYSGFTLPGIGSAAVVHSDGKYYYVDVEPPLMPEQQ